MRLIDESKPDFRRPNVAKSGTVLSKICARGCNNSKQILGNYVILYSIAVRNIEIDCKVH